MAVLRIEGDKGEPLRDLAREPYDLGRRAVLEPKAVCHAPFASLHVGRSLAACRHSVVDFGDPKKTSIADGFQSDAARQMRERFRHYVVRRSECLRCVHHWEDEAATESPAQAEYDVSVPPVNGVPPRLHALSVDARVDLPTARFAEIRALLPELSQVVVVCDELLPGHAARQVIEAVDQLRSGPRPKLRVIAEGFVPASDSLPSSVTALEVELPLRRGGLDDATKEALAELADEFAERGAPLLVRTAVGRTNWIELESWLADVLACRATPAVEPFEREHADSFAALDADTISVVHAALYRFSVELGVANDEKLGDAAFRNLLARLRHWQKEAADRHGAAPPLTLPELDHPLLADETKARRLLQDALRLYHHPRVEQWLARIAHHRHFVRGARERLSLRLVALWLGCVFERSDVRPALRSIYEDPIRALARIAADRSQLAGSAMASWHDGWVKELELEKEPRGGPPFEVPPAKPRKTAGRAQVTVVVPSFNHEKFVGPAIDSVLAQTGPNVRVLVVDDGSSDGTVAAARTRDDPRVKVRRNARNLGLGESLFAALRSVDTRYVAVLNSDDLFHPERLERLVAALEKSPRAAVAASTIVPIDADGRRCTTADSSPIFDGKRVHDWLRWFESATKKTPRAPELLGALFERNFLVTSSNLVCRRDFLLEHAPLWRQLEYCVDWQLFLAAAAQGELRVVDEPLVAYRLHASNTVWFDEEREWRYYVESHRVVARTLELALERDHRDAPQRFAAQLEVVAEHLAENRGVDWAGVYLGLLLERLKVPSRAIRGEQSRRWIESLDAMRQVRVRASELVHLLGENLSEHYRLKGERPWLVAARNRAEAVGDELERTRWELIAARRERQSIEKLWRRAERERDFEIAGKAELHQKIGDLQGRVEQEQKKATDAQSEASHLRESRDQLQNALQTVQGEHDQVRKDLERALGSLSAGQDRVKADLVDALQSVKYGHEFVRTELVNALERIQTERTRIEDGLSNTIEGVTRQREETVARFTREREALRATLERLHEETAHLHAELDRARLELAAERERAQADLDEQRTDAMRRLEEESRRLTAILESERSRLQTMLTEERAAVERALAQQRERHARELAAEREALAQLLVAERDARERALAAERDARSLVEQAAAAKLAAEREQHARTLAAEQAAHEERLLAVGAEEEAARADAAQASAAERAALERRWLEERAAVEQRLGVQLTALESARAAARHEAESQRQRADEVTTRALRLEEELALQKNLVNQRTWERDGLRRAPEFRLGDLVLNTMKLKTPLRSLEKKSAKLRVAWTRTRLRAERRGWIHSSGGKPKVCATICWNFPIYSQTFVHQELTQLKNRGFDVRVIYSMLESKDHLPKQFHALWKAKRPMHLDRHVHENDYKLWKARQPDRVEHLVRRLCDASGLAREKLEQHDNFLQGFSYARLVESWGADYLHSYFFYDRSLMSLIAGELLELPRGVSCYADHLLKDYELKVVPLHLQTCELVIATSARIKRELLQLAPDVNPDKILVKPNAIDCTRFPVIPRPEPEPGQPFRLVVTSRIEPKKGLVHLVDAVKLLRDEGVNVEAHVVGDVDKGVPASENCKAELCEKITKLDLWGKFHLEGRQPEAGVRRFLSISQLFVAPFVETSSGDKDGIPTALVEAMATGIPCVVTDSGSMLEVVDDGVDALVVPQRNPRALAAAIRQLLLDPKGRKHMGEKAAQKAREKFDVSICEPWFHDRVRSILAARKR
jgi:glycosyltransferase involved in cell wall biosynthesis